MEILRSDGAGPEPASWLKRASLLKIPRLAKTSVLSRIHIGTGPAHPNGGNDEYPIDQVDRASNDAIPRYNVVPAGPATYLGRSATSEVCHALSRHSVHDGGADGPG